VFALPVLRTRLRDCTKPSYFVMLIFLLHAAGTDLGEEIGAEQADGKDNQHKGDDQVHQGGEEITDLEGNAADVYSQALQTLACRSSRRQQRSDDVIGQRGEELGNNRRKIERRRKYDKILGIQHIGLYSLLHYFLHLAEE
jgi:hypothetical protein